MSDLPCIGVYLNFTTWKNKRNGQSIFVNHHGCIFDVNSVPLHLSEQSVGTKSLKISYLNKAKVLIKNNDKEFENISTLVCDVISWPRFISLFLF